MAESPKVKRQVQILQFYLKGRIKQLNAMASASPAAAEQYELAIAELQLIQDQILPEFIRTIS